MEVRSRTFPMSPIDRAARCPPLFVPPVPDFSSWNPSPLAFVHRFSRNGLRARSIRTYDLNWLEKGFFGLKRLLLNKSEMIHCVRVENHSN